MRDCPIENSILPEEKEFLSTDITWLHEDCCKIQFSNGAVFFIRAAYLSLLCIEDLEQQQTYTAKELEDITQAQTIYKAEQTARRYLERSEHSRFMLVRKLTAKGISAESIQKALDYLEEQGVLSDRRFAQAWVHTRIIHKYEGRSRLTAELSARGIHKHEAQTAVDKLFITVSEKELCKKAIQRCRKQGKTDKALRAALGRYGFSYKLITTCLAETDNHTEL